MSLSQQDDTTVARAIHSFSVEKAIVFWLYSLQIPSFACVLFTFWVKMPWPFSESIKKRACRYLLHRYLGNFLQEKLSLDQLSLDLYQGTGSLAQVPLDKWVCALLPSCQELMQMNLFEQNLLEQWEFTILFLIPQSLNELLETADAPFEVIAGFIQTISLTVPWAALVQENCALEVKGLEMVLRPRPRVGKKRLFCYAFVKF